MSTTVKQTLIDNFVTEDFFLRILNFNNPETYEKQEKKYENQAKLL